MIETGVLQRQPHVNDEFVDHNSFCQPYYYYYFMFNIEIFI